MRIVFDIDFGSTYSQTHFGIYDFYTNTLEYFAKSKLEEKVRKGYEVTDLAMTNVAGLQPQIDIQNTCTYPIPALQKQKEEREYNHPTKSYLNLIQPIYLKNLKSGLYFYFNGVTFAYQKRKKGNEWGVVFPSGMTIEAGLQVLYQLVPYLLCGDVFILHMDSIYSKTLDLSSLAELSQTKRIKLYSSISKDYGNIKLVGQFENIDFTDLFTLNYNMKEAYKEFRVIDLSGLYTNKTLEPRYFSFISNIRPNSVVLLPNVTDCLDNCKHFISSSAGLMKTPSEWIYLGNLNKQSNYIQIAKTQIAKYSLMGKKLEDYIFYAIVG